MTTKDIESDIVPFIKENHLAQAVACIMKVRLNDPTYPPQIDAPDIISSVFIKWLISEPVTHRWVALVEGKVVGHISLSEGHDYLTSHLESNGEKPYSEKGYLEIGKFYINPDFQGHGIGAKLLEHAIDTSLKEGFTPALAVISTSTKAIEVYKRKKMKSIGYFNGIHGKNFIFVGLKP